MEDMDRDNLCPDWVVVDELSDSEDIVCDSHTMLPTGKSVPAKPLKDAMEYTKPARNIDNQPPVVDNLSRKLEHDSKSEPSSKEVKKYQCDLLSTDGLQKHLATFLRGTISPGTSAQVLPLGSVSTQRVLYAS